jgi:uncharacterized membrane protein
MSNTGDRFWGGFAVGALVGTAAAVAGYAFVSAFRGGRNSRILRLEDSIQIGRRVEDVFNAWSDLTQLPQHLHTIKRVEVDGRHSRWEAEVDGRTFRWSAETIHFIPNEAIGWKSVTGPKHTGRITFSPIGDDTLVHVTMNYHPPLGRFGRLISPVTEHLDAYVKEGLREFKEALEGKHSPAGRTYPARGVQESNPAEAEWRVQAEKASGTYGAESSPAATQEPKQQTVRYTRPTEPKYP